MDLDCNVTEADFTGLKAAINRLHVDCGVGIEEASRRGVILLVKSLRSRTPRSKKVRPVRALPHRRPIVVDGVKKRFYLTQVYRRGQSGSRPLTILAASAAEARKDKRARIERYGLARASWGWFMHALFGKSAGPNPNPAAVVQPGFMVFASRTERDGEAHIVIENRLDYIRKVLPPSALAESVTASKNRMNHLIEARIARAAARGMR